MSAAMHNPALVLADGWQRDFPLQPEPFAALAEPAELSQLEVMELMRSLKDQGVLARVGATVRPIRLA
ncbi:MAG: Lrp/AsnC family transcriptional regulator, partial [Hyphomicrobiales bacterium]|nr:Lrp/AsnC family transcriptional regulator [Hyphomicrobiales bacterium]